jgi:hypothetical protein
LAINKAFSNTSILKVDYPNYESSGAIKHLWASPFFYGEFNMLQSTRMIIYDQYGNTMLRQMLSVAGNIYITFPLRANYGLHGLALENYYEYCPLHL